MKALPMIPTIGQSQAIGDFGGLRIGGAEGRRLMMAAVFALAVLAPLAMASATVLNVGPHGTYASIQTAVNNALGAGSHEVRVEMGSYTENVEITSSFTGDRLDITGGWDGAFATRTDDPSLTTVDGNQAESVFSVSTASGNVLIEGFTITNGASFFGGGVEVTPSGTAVVTIRGNLIIGNTARSHSVPAGGGIYVNIQSGSSHCEVFDNVISGNTALNTLSGPAAAGGLDLDVQDAATFVAQGNRIEDNICSSSLEAVFGCGARVYHNSTGISEFHDNIIRGNRTDTPVHRDVLGAGGRLIVGPSGTALIARRNLWIDNLDLESQNGYHVQFLTHGSGILRTSDSVVAGGPDIGVGAWSYDTSVLRLTNLTVHGHSVTGVLLEGFGAASSLFNTIVFGSATSIDLSGTTVSTGGNLNGTDPLFIDPVNGDFHLHSGSPALNAGDNSPPNGLGPSDADGNPRVIDGVVDIGAYEGVADIFEDGFESANTDFWSSDTP